PREGVVSLWAMEWARLVRTRRWIGLLAPFILFGFTGPLVTRYQRELFRNLGGGIRVIVPPPSVGQAIDSYVKNVAQIGLLAVVAVAAWAVAIDARPEWAAFLRTRTSAVGRLLVQVRRERRRRGSLLRGRARLRLVRDGRPDRKAPRRCDARRCLLRGRLPGLRRWRRHPVGGPDPKRGRGRGALAGDPRRAAAPGRAPRRRAVASQHAGRGRDLDDARRPMDRLPSDGWGGPRFRSRAGLGRCPAHRAPRALSGEPRSPGRRAGVNPDRRRGPLRSRPGSPW